MKTIYSVRGTVQHGKKLGRTIGIPTINIFPENQNNLPKNGVYYSLVRFETGNNAGKQFRGMTNIGCKPTVKDTSVINLETYIYDFNEEVYGEEVTVELLKFRRSEVKFTSVDELMTAMSEDVEAGKEYFDKTFYQR